MEDSNKSVDQTLYEIFDQWKKSELIKYILSIQTDEEKLDFLGE